mmetsp:Transcript_26822/g.85204  ORF Transcript_26822/g.85204 Transcript_26822/m.85204 type:complete len:241 (-) Transcript_26822:188-910(-)
MLPSLFASMSFMTSRASRSSSASAPKASATAPPKSTSRSSSMEILPSPLRSKTRKAAQHTLSWMSCLRLSAAARNSVYSSAPPVSEPSSTMTCSRSAGMSLRPPFFRPSWSSATVSRPSPFASSSRKVSRRRLSCFSSNCRAAMWSTAFFSLLSDLNWRRWSMKPSWSRASGAFGACSCTQTLPSASPAEGRFRGSRLSSSFTRDLPSSEMWHQCLMSNLARPRRTCRSTSTSVAPWKGG